MKTVALVLVAGMLQALSLAWPFEGVLKGESQGWLQCVCLAVLAFYVDRSATAKQAFATAWLFAIAWLGAAFGGCSFPCIAMAAWLHHWPRWLWA